MIGYRTLPGKRALTDKGGEFVNCEIDTWYEARGIEHVEVGLKNTLINPLER